MEITYRFIHQTYGYSSIPRSFGLSSKKSILFSQALCFNRIFSENKVLDNRCNQLKCRLKDSILNENFESKEIYYETLI